MLRKILAIILGLVVLMVAGVVALASIQPDEFRVERTARINAPPEKIYPLINDFRGWRAWSPYEKLDPEMRRSYSPVAIGKGAVYEWEGKNVGAGRMEITDATAPSKIVINLRFT